VNRARLDTCGCFPRLPAPPRIYNRPGLEALDYRIATHPAVLARLLGRLDAAGHHHRADAAAAVASWLLVADTVPQQVPPGEAAAGAHETLHRLQRLRTRREDDPAIALLDAYAVVADVLSFYQERIANEGYLRTASERRSILELARLIGYELSPGVAAHAWLSFQVEERGEEAPISTEPPRAAVPEHTRVQSIPSDGGLPQTFETSEELPARAEWNAMTPRLTEPQALDKDARTIYLKGTATRLEAGDWLLIAEGSDSGPVTGTAAKQARRVVVEADLDRTRVDFEDKPKTPPVQPAPAVPAGVVTLSPTSFGKPGVDYFLGSNWSNAQISAFLAVQRWSLGAVYSYATVPPKPQVELPAAAPGVFALRQRAGIFGHNAPRRRNALSDDGWAVDWDDAATKVNATTKDSQASAGDRNYSRGLDLEAVFPRVVAGSWAVLVDRQAGETSPMVVRVADAEEISRADYAISGKATHLELVKLSDEPPENLTGFGLRTTTVHCESERLELADLPLSEEIESGAKALELDRLVLGLEVGQPVAVAGEDAELDGVRWAEIVRLSEVTHGGGRTTIHFDALEHSYKRATVAVSANVVEATHGETVEEALGGGDGSAHQRFRLAKPPLTHVSAATAGGVESTLEVRVDGVLWRQARGLYGLGEGDERYVVHRDDDGHTHVVFGDGERGARPPSGVENVRARYRSGIGSAGLAPTGKLSLLQTRPAGIRAVVNPLPATGAENPEHRDSARTNAPLEVMTLDRVVAVRDYEDFARGFAGVGKARASALWTGERRLVHVTVAGPGGVDVDDQTGAKLLDALVAAGDPAVEVRIGSFHRLPFELAVNVLLDGRREREAAREAIREELASRFSFERREFGQPVTEAEVVSATLGVGGVVDARVEVLRPIPRVGAPAPAKQDPLAARVARWSTEVAGAVEPAELLMLSATGAEVTEREEAA
jgi:hypothetical protein